MDTIDRENIKYAETPSGNLVLDYVGGEIDNYELYMETNNGNTFYELETLFEYEHAIKVFERTIKMYQ